MLYTWIIFSGFSFPNLVLYNQGALLVARDKMFQQETGDRLGVENKLVLVTDGLSDIRPDLVPSLAQVCAPLLQLQF